MPNVMKGSFLALDERFDPSIMKGSGSRRR